MGSRFEVINLDAFLSLTQCSGQKRIGKDNMGSKEGTVPGVQ